MKLLKKRLDGVFEIPLDPRRDERGFFIRIYDDQIFRDLNLNTKWFQDSRSFTARKNTLRGLHVSLPPSLEGKFIHAVRGAMLWVVVDLRLKSKTFGEWESVILTDQNPSAIYVERGFGHGCRSLTDDCDLFIKADNHYSEAHGTGIAWNDPDLDIDWKLEGTVPLVSARDQAYGSFQDFRGKHGGIE